MTPPRLPSGRQRSLRDYSEPEKMDVTGSWDTLEWNKFDSELGTRKVIPLGTIPLAAIEKFNKMVLKVQLNPRQSDKNPPRRLLQVTGKDMRIIVYGFRPRTKQRRDVFDALLKCSKPERVWDLYTFACGPSKFGNANPKERLLNEYFRLLGKSSLQASMDMIED